MKLSPPIRVEFIGSTDSTTRLQPGERGTVESSDEAGTLQVQWDNGICSGLVEGKDQWLSRPAPTGALDGHAALALLELMEDISEEHYAAGWMSGLEESLWWIAHGGGPMYGMIPVSDERIAALRVLAHRAGGWWHWCEHPVDDEPDETFIALDKWEQRFARRAEPEWVDEVRRARE